MFFYVLIVLACFSYFILKLRYEFLYLPLYLIAKIQGHNFKIARSIDEVKRALMLSDKGRGIEELVAQPAWAPILSLESVNGPKWIELKTNFLYLQKHFSSIRHLSFVTKYEENKFLHKCPNAQMNSEDISKLTLKIFV